jgi:hypothetical protein
MYMRPIGSLKRSTPSFCRSEFDAQRHTALQRFALLLEVSLHGDEVKRCVVFICQIFAPNFQTIAAPLDGRRSGE